MILIAQSIEYLFTFLAVVGITITIDNLSEGRRNIRALRLLPEFTNGRQDMARIYQRRAVFSLLQYCLLLVAGFIAIFSEVTHVTTVGMAIRLVLCAYVLILMVSDVMDMLDRRRLIYRRARKEQ